MLMYGRCVVLNSLRLLWRNKVNIATQITASCRGKQVALMIRRAAAGQSRAPARPTHVSNQLNIEQVAFKTTIIPLMGKFVLSNSYFLLFFLIFVFILFLLFQI